IAYIDKGKRLTLPARADDEQGYAKGERVYVIAFEGNTALVRLDRDQLWGERPERRERAVD
ncbi:MAG: NfeD family protein, partial [Blastocatellia bacterium]